MTKDSVPTRVGNSPLAELLGVRASGRFPRLLAAVNIGQRIIRILAQLLKSATIEARSSEAGAGFGMLVALAAWLVAAHMFDAEALGIGAVLVSGLVVIGLFAAIVPLPWLRRSPSLLGPCAASTAIALVLASGVAYGASAVSASVASTINDPWRLAWFAVAAGAAALLLLARDLVAREYGFRGFVLIDAVLASAVIALVEAAIWLYGTAPQGSLLIEGARNYPSQFRNYENFVYLPLANEPAESRARVVADPVGVLGQWLADRSSGYVILTRSQKATVEALGIMPPAALDRIEWALSASPRFRVVYANPDARIFTLNPAVAGFGDHLDGDRSP